MNRRRIIVAALIGLLVLAGAGLVLARASQTSKQALDPHGMALPAQRTVQLSTVMPTPSDYDGLHAKLIEGTMPAAETVATVLTDEQCQPDADGISHCLNRILLSDGSEIAVRHPHDMDMVPCLAPGEHVRLMPAL